ncbi:MAG: hypothetical protein PUB33_06370 [Ligilactobacillus ruminis]|nr:hypothetical protein [Ligilactobacillus ruminis]
MAKPGNKAELTEEAAAGYEALLKMIADRTEEEKAGNMIFRATTRKKKHTGKGAGICATF